MPILLKATSVVLLSACATLSALAQSKDNEAPGGEPLIETQAAGPVGTFVDEYGTSFEFSLCGASGTDLCGLLLNLEGESATEENLAFVGKQVMQAARTAPNQWKGSLAVGERSAEATVTQTGPDTVEIEGCRAAILCQTLVYRRAS